MEEEKVKELAEGLKARHLVGTMDEAMEMARRILSVGNGQEPKPRLPSVYELEDVNQDASKPYDISKDKRTVSELFISHTEARGLAGQDDEEEPKKEGKEKEDTAADKP